MPGYISHTIMASDIGKRLKRVDKTYLETFSLGGDLTKYAKCRYLTHHKNQEVFIYELADYIRHNNLTNNPEMMSLLYGHIMHYIMDKIIHPLVYEIGNGKNHARIEEYIDSLLVRKIIKKEIKEYTKSLRLRIRFNKDIKNCLNKTYLKVYDNKHINIYYRFNIYLYRNLNRLYSLFGNKIYKISKLNKYLVNNDISKYDDKILDYYYKALDRALIYINKINTYIGISK